MKFIVLILTIGAVFAVAAPARAQEPELVNQIVARVNNDIITHLDWLNALRDFREELGRQMQGKSEAELNAEYERLKKAGVEFHTEPQIVGVFRATYGRDPDGNIFELQEVMDSNHPVSLTNLVPSLAKG